MIAGGIKVTCGVEVFPSIPFAFYQRNSTNVCQDIATTLPAIIACSVHASPFIQSINTSVTPFSSKTLEKRCVSPCSQSGSSERIHKFLSGYHCVVVDVVRFPA